MFNVVRAINYLQINSPESFASVMKIMFDY
jgi:hypothetical protein